MRAKFIAYWQDRVPLAVAKQQADWEIRQLVWRAFLVGFTIPQIMEIFGKPQAWVSLRIRFRKNGGRRRKSPVERFLEITPRHKRMLLLGEGLAKPSQRALASSWSEACGDARINAVLAARKTS